MKFTDDDAERYSRHYDEPRFRQKLKQVAATAGSKVLYPALQLYYLLQAKEVPVKAKTLIIGALGYLILPADLVPDFIPALGFTDDLTAIMIALRTLGHYLTPEISSRAKEHTNRLLGRNTDNNTSKQHTTT